MHVLRADGRIGLITGYMLVPGVQTMYNLEVAHDHTFTVGAGQWVVHNACGPRNLIDGMKMTVNEALDAAENFLGKGYRDLGNGRFVSADGRRQVRMGDSDILGWHGGGPHINFEILEDNPFKPGKLRIIRNIHIHLLDR
jgi:hypothetical protein